MTSTQFFTWLYNGGCMLIAIGMELLADSDFIAIIPPRYKHAVAIASLVAMAIRSKKNLTINRDGTPDSVAYVPPGQAAAPMTAKKPGQ